MVKHQGTVPSDTLLNKWTLSWKGHLKNNIVKNLPQLITIWLQWPCQKCLMITKVAQNILYISAKVKCICKILYVLCTSTGCIGNTLV